MIDKRFAVRAGLLCLALAGLAGLTSDAPACDTDVYAVARLQWMPERYMLVMAYQPGAGDPEPLHKAAASLQVSQRANLDVLTFDLSRPSRWSSDRMLQRGLNLWGFPLVVLLDEQGQPLAMFQTLAEARRRLAPPAEDAGAGSFGDHYIELQKPARRIVIVTDSRLKTDIAAPATQPDEKPTPVLVPANEVAGEWAASIAAEPLAGLNKADIVDVRQPGADLAMLKTTKLAALPVCMLANPDGEVLATFDQVPTEEQLEGLAFSPACEFVRKSLSDPDTAMAVLFIYGSNVETSAKSLAATWASTRHSSRLYQVRIPVYEVDPNDPREAFLIKQLKLFGLNPGKDDCVIVPFIGHCKALRDPLQGVIVPDDLNERMQIAFHECGCGVTPRQYGMDLLMGLSERNWPPFKSELGEKIGTVAKTIEVPEDEFTRDAALAGFGVSPRTLLYGGLGIAGAIVLLAGLVFFIKLNAMKSRGA